MKYAFIVIFLNICNLLYSQKINTSIGIYKDTIRNKDYRVKEITVINNTDEEYLTWVSSYPVSHLPNYGKIRQYFTTHYVDFHLLVLVYENLLSTNSLCCIGKTFIKNIPPKHSFKYLLKDFRAYKKQWKERLVIIKRKEVEKFLNINFADEWFYGEDKVLVNPRLIFFDRPPYP